MSARELGLCQRGLKNFRWRKNTASLVLSRGSSGWSVEDEPGPPKSWGDQGQAAAVAQRRRGDVRWRQEVVAGGHSGQSPKQEEESLFSAPPTSPSNLLKTTVLC